MDFLLPPIIFPSKQDATWTSIITITTSAGSSSPQRNEVTSERCQDPPRPIAVASLLGDVKRPITSFTFLTLTRFSAHCHPTISIQFTISNKYKHRNTSHSFSGSKIIYTRIQLIQTNKHIHDNPSTSPLQPLPAPSPPTPVPNTSPLSPASSQCNSIHPLHISTYSFNTSILYHVQYSPFIIHSLPLYSTLQYVLCLQSCTCLITYYLANFIMPPFTLLPVISTILASIPWRLL